MRLHAIFCITSVLPALFAFAAPVPEVQDNDVPSPAIDPTPTITFAAYARAVTPTPSITVAAYVRAATPTPSSPAAFASAADSCPLYTAADAVHLSSRDIREYEKRVGEELWFKFDDPAVATGGKNFLQLAARNGNKDFDDQAYKWISTDISKVERGKIPKRVPTMYVLPAGTRDKVLGAAQPFETASTSKHRADFVVKENERGDVGIQGVSRDASGALPLDIFRNEVMRVVTKSTSNKAGGKATFTTIGADGKTSNTASKSDQVALNRFC